MNKFFILFFFLLSCSCVYAAGDTNKLLEELKAQIGKREIYDNNKALRIKKLKIYQSALSKNDYNSQFNTFDNLYNEYKSYQFDSAYVYVDKMIYMSKLKNDKPREYYSYVKLAFILLSSGMFHEAFEYLNKVDVSVLTNAAKIDYYFFLARCNYDVANYSNDKYFTPDYIDRGNKFIDSAISFCGNDRISEIYFTGLQKQQERNFDEGRVEFSKLLNPKMQITMHLRAMVSCALGAIYLETNQKEEGLNLMIKSAIADVKSSTRETVALYTLANLLYKEGNIKDAYNFIQIAQEDADFYGARQRKIQIGAILPLIATAELNNSEHQKNQFLVLLLTITTLALLVVFFLVMIGQQLKKLKIKEVIIEGKNLELNGINEKLWEDSKIKEEYIGQFFKEISGYILKLENLKISVNAKLSMKKYDAIHTLIDHIDIKKERKNLYYSFDHIFIKIFPNFIGVFNELFDEKDKIWPDSDEVLNTDLRIFALIRMGITDNDTIAKILEYSVNTIYVYKMRIKAKSLNPELFEKRIMDIRTIDTFGKFGVS
ncbi:DUF6377 domain-containing protein [Mucilaginibacter sp. FT3.2]|uniref:DUF6377 domain-containing protein n=1 Tax=Mucilaginibacter sp. FT3.2 TaxID=2723090 RepID=UPI00160B53B0|nr:DUF6377 domain-containing protein [Mucilaginibacter sp. FT3.2]MBB6231523.1 tetratricopeptide (TPR) repeat protein [Mucilaginibacter sp. FT3.2]